MKVALTDRAVTILPAHGYQLIRINDDIGQTPVELRLSEPEIVLGFVVIQTERYNFMVHPVTAFGVRNENNGETNALIRPDGKVDLTGIEDCVLQSIDDLKQHLRAASAATFRDHAADLKKDGEDKEAERFRRVAQKFQDEFDENDDR
jgi:hypothetical protein